MEFEKPLQRKLIDCNLIDATVNKTQRLLHGPGKSEEPIITATVDYERWLKRHVAVVETDLQLKHKEMAASLFAFLRATFYRWASLWPEVCPDLTKDTPRVGGGGSSCGEFRNLARCRG